VDSLIKLSICIATLNRGPLIGHTLDSIVSQLTEEVEVIIVDGASTDNTEEVVLSYRKRYANLNYTRLEKKGGIDQDFTQAVELAAGEYCWLFSDDDIIKPGAIKAILGILETSPGLVIVNAEVQNSNLTQILKPSCLDLSETTKYSASDVDRLFLDAGRYLSFIGCVVIRRSLWISRDKAKYFGTLFVHVGVIFQKPIPEEVLIIAEPMIVIRYGNSMWTTKAFEVSHFKWPELIWSFNGISDDAKTKVTECEPWRNITRLMLYRARGLYSFDEYRNLIKNKLSSPLSRLLMVMIAIAPVKFFNIFFMIYFTTIGSKFINAKINISDLEDAKKIINTLKT
jgi:abequosyltransferase